MLYLSLKLIHILCATLVFGTGIALAILGTQVFRSQNPSLISDTGSRILKLELYLTVAGAVGLLGTGSTMLILTDFALLQAWLIWALLLLVLAAACWLAGLSLQHAMLNLAKQSLAQATSLPASYQGHLNRWLLLGLPSTLAMTGIFYLMVFKPA